MLAILGSRNTEIRQIKEQMTGDPERIYAGITYFPGTIDGAAVVVAEIGSETIPAAAATQIAVDRFGADEVISVGPAQPLVPYLQEGDLVIGERLWQFDPNRMTRMDEIADLFDDESVISSDYGLVRRLEDAYKNLFARQSSRPQLISGGVVSDDHRTFSKRTSNLLHRRFGAVAYDSTGAALAEVCCMNDVSLVVVRTVTEIMPEPVFGDESRGITAGPMHAVMLILEIISTRSTAPVA